jgi:hypothetical protein
VRALPLASKDVLAPTVECPDSASLAGDISIILWIILVIVFTYHQPVVPVRVFSSVSAVPSDGNPLPGVFL